MIFPLVFQGYANNVANRWVCVCVCWCVRACVLHIKMTCVFLHIPFFEFPCAPSIMRTLLLFLPATFPAPWIPSATNAGLNYHKSIWLLITQHRRKKLQESWPCVSSGRWALRANSTECVTRLQITVLIKSDGNGTHAIPALRPKKSWPAVVKLTWHFHVCLMSCHKTVRKTQSETRESTAQNRTQAAKKKKKSVRT